MTPTEVDRFLSEQRVCRLASSTGTRPHVTPLWFVWMHGSIWVSSVVRSQRWADIARNPRVAVVIDDGISYAELRGVEIEGLAEPVGEIPRMGLPHPQLEEVEAGFQRKYFPPDTPLVHDGRHAVLRIVPQALRSWDFRRLGSGG